MNGSLYWRAVLAVGCIAAVVLAGGCSGSPATPLPGQVQAAPPLPSPTLAPSPSPSSPPLPVYFSTEQKIIEGLANRSVDIRDVDAMFDLVFSQLTPQVTVYPTENYYYYILNVNSRQLWGNIRLAAGHRDLGELSFAYFEFSEFYQLNDVLTRAKYFTEKDGVKIEKVDDFTYIVRYKGKAVTFNLNRIPQKPPRLFTLDKDEKFIERTMDESGYQFILIFNEKYNYFLYVLNEEDPLLDVLDPMADSTELFVGRRSAFIFWKDAAHDNRKILMAVRAHSVQRNDYYDGPFDQLADNYADEAHISEYMQKAYPSLKGRIDKFGYFLDSDRPLRVAINAYTNYYTYAEAAQFLEKAKASGNPCLYISKQGIPDTPMSTGTPSPVPGKTGTPTPTAKP